MSRITLGTISLLACRWRGDADPETGHYECGSVKIRAPGGVRAVDCASCYLRNHDPCPPVVPPWEADKKKKEGHRYRLDCVYNTGPTGETRACGYG